MAQDTSFLALYVLCNAISPVRMTICAVLPVRGKEIGTVNNKLNQSKYNKKRTVPLLCVYCVFLIHWMLV